MTKQSTPLPNPDNVGASAAPTAYLLTLGCPKNEVDSQIIAARLSRRGWRLVADPAAAELIVINTCAFIREAKEESIAAILEAGEYKKAGSCRWLVVIGCLAQRYGTDLKELLPEVDLFLGINDIPHIEEQVQAVVGGISVRNKKIGKPTFLQNSRHERSQPGHYAYLKIADGCDNCCSYCAIPQIRGKYRSRAIADVLAEARNLAQLGAKELIISAQDTTLFGKDRRGAEENIAMLLRRLSEIEEVHWLRLLYTHPVHITDDLLEAIAQETKVCKYIDMPLQHINDQILNSMNRRVTKRGIKECIERIRRKIPQVALRTALIVGYPLETPKRFAELLAFVEEARFEHLGVFCYSREEDTPAFRLGSRVSQREKEERRGLIMETQARISYEINRSLVGSTHEVIIDAIRPDGSAVGRSGRQAPEIDGVTFLRRAKGVRVGDIRLAKIEKAAAYDLYCSHFIK